MDMKTRKWKDETEYIWYGGKKSGYAHLTEDHMTKILEHVKKYLGELDESEEVYHETKSNYVHIDVIPVILQDKYPFNILVTMGMSAKPMNVPEEAEASKYAELVILLPKDWKLTAEFWGNETYSWPISVIKHLAVFPHKNNTFFGYGHAISNGDPAKPYAENTELCYMFFDKPKILPKEFNHLKINDKKIIDFLCLVPIYREEFELKRVLGANALEIVFEDQVISQIVDINREKCCEGSSDVLGDSVSFDDEYPKPNEKNKKNLKKSVKLLQLGNNKKALQLFEKSLLKRGGHYVYPNEIRDFLLAATDIILNKRIQGSNKISESFSNKIKEYWFRLADHHEFDYCEYDCVAECVDYALKINQNINYDGAAVAARAYANTKQYEKELSICDLILKDDPNDDYLLEMKVDALRELGRYKESLEHLDRLREIFSFKNPLLEDWRVGLLNLNGKYEETILEIEKKLMKYPNRSDDLYEKAYALYKLGRTKEAITILKKSIQFDMNDERKANSLYFLGYIYATENGDYQESLNYLKKAYKLNDSDSKIKKTKEIIEKIIKDGKKEIIAKKNIAEYEHFFWH
jgi:tetratricopeptide (TPR) repeat protein